MLEGAENSETLAAGTTSVSLADATALGVSVSKSLPFVVDAAPSSGHVQLLPVNGGALKTRFTFSTNGWSDEDESVHLVFCAKEMQKVVGRVRAERTIHPCSLHSSFSRWVTATVSPWVFISVHVCGMGRDHVPI